MMKKQLLWLGIFTVVFSLMSCQEVKTEPGTYEGTVTTVNADQQEIFVETKDMETVQVLFTERTKVTANGEVMDFSALQQGQHVTVRMEKIGDAVEPTLIEITHSYPAVEPENP